MHMQHSLQLVKNKRQNSETPNNIQLLCEKQSTIQ